MPSGLQLHLYNQAQPMWEHLHEIWREDTDSLLVSPSPLAVERFIRQQASSTLWQERMITLPELWFRVAQGQPNKPPTPLAPLEIRTVLEEILCDRALPRPLRSLRHSARSLDALATHLGQIEERADRSYRPLSEIEQGIQRIREVLHERGQTTHSGFRTMAARVAQYYKGGCNLIFTPIGLASPHIGGLLKGVSRQQRVTAFFLTNRAVEKELLDLLGLLGLDPSLAERHYTPHISQIIFQPSAPATGHAEREATPKAQYLIGNQAEIMIEQAAGWMEKGTPAGEIGIVLDHPSDAYHQLETLARERGVPLFLRWQISVRECKVGTLLMRLATANTGDKRVTNALMERYPKWLRAEDIELLHSASTTLGQLECLYRIGLNMTERNLEVGKPVPPHLADALLWLQGLQSAIDHFKRNEIIPPRPDEVLEEVRSGPLAFGDIDGVMVLSYTEASAFQFRYGLFGSLTFGAYPPAPEASPFVSAELLQRIPELREPSRRAEFVAAVATAEYPVLVRDQASMEGVPLQPSPFWQAAHGPRAVSAREDNGNTQSSGKELRTRRRALYQAVREKQRHQLIDKAIARSSRKQLPVGVGGTKADFSVTELETFERCPYGWFVDRVLKPRTPSGPSALRGTAAHNILAEAIHAPDRLEELVERECGKLFGATEQEIMREQLARALARYSGDDWPYQQYECETDLRSSCVLEGVSIHGRVDRIDLSDRGLLVIDYKSRRSPRAGAGGKEYQRYLYPLMAREKYQRDVDGMLYISLFHSDHEGSLARPIPGIDTHVDYSWSSNAEEAVERANQLVAKIQAGEWTETGSNCASWCGHHAISQTARTR